MLIFYLMIGMILFSFGDCYSYRKSKGMNYLTDRSRCESCGHVLKWFELLPLVSYLALRGKCRYCGRQISLRPFLSEVIGLVCGGIAYSKGFVALFILCNLYVLALMDQKTKSVPFVSCIPLLLICIIVSYMDLDLFSRLFGSLLISVPMSLLNVIKKDSFGWGDVILFLLLGYIYKIDIIYIALLALGIASLYALYLMGILKKTKEYEFAFIPFLFLGVLLYLLL